MFRFVFEEVWNRKKNLGMVAWEDLGSSARKEVGSWIGWFEVGEHWMEENKTGRGVWRNLGHGHWSWEGQGLVKTGYWMVIYMGSGVTQGKVWPVVVKECWTARWQSPPWKCYNQMGLIVIIKFQDLPREVPVYKPDRMTPSLTDPFKYSLNFFCLHKNRWFTVSLFTFLLFAIVFSISSNCSLC